MPSVAIRELELLPPGVLDTILYMRHFAFAKTELSRTATLGHEAYLTYLQADPVAQEVLEIERELIDEPDPPEDES